MRAGMQEQPLQLLMGLDHLKLEFPCHLATYAPIRYAYGVQCIMTNKDKYRPERAIRGLDSSLSPFRFPVIIDDTDIQMWII